jgi:hypothetical protein
MSLDVTITNKLLEDLQKIPFARRQKIFTELGKMEWDRCADSLEYWMNPHAHYTPYVYTFDPHPMYKCLLCDPDNQDLHVNSKHKIHLELVHNKFNPSYDEMKQYFKEAPTIKPFPHKEYFYILAEYWQYQPLFLIEKSRDMMATWMTIVFYTWDTIFHSGRQNFFQSQTAKKTRELVKRAKFIYDHQPKFIKDLHKFKFAIGLDGAGELTCDSLSSEIIGVPQGSDQVRQYHPSGIFTDETAFHNQASETFAAVKPAIQNGGRYTGVSSAFPGWFQMACSDNLELDL